MTKITGTAKEIATRYAGAKLLFNYKIDGYFYVSGTVFGYIPKSKNNKIEDTLCIKELIYTNDYANESLTFDNYIGNELIIKLIPVKGDDEIDGVYVKYFNIACDEPDKNELKKLIKALEL